MHQLYVAIGNEEAGPIAEIRGLAQAAGVPVRSVDRTRITALAHTDAPQGVVAIADPLEETTLSRMVKAGADGRRPFLVVLDGVTDPHNLGAVMRSALCAGATGMVIGKHRSAHITAAAAKAAAGAIEHLPVALVSGIPAALSELKHAGVWTVGLDSAGDRPLWHLEVATEAVALVLGAEGRGLARLTQQRCELVVSVPLIGPLDSLNVAAAAALACFEVARRRTSPS
ncbi:MAG: 23S rRNA (guanosine(2251)-2'-O)-methyltransferase RlmB [Actinomycetota bacterium]|nr:23S rRNA (guanosine(2251)-2'-O)-methyltransferase RlmB [Actinomycetota bacterium]